MRFDVARMHATMVTLALAPQQSVVAMLPNVYREIDALLLI